MTELLAWLDQLAAFYAFVTWRLWKTSQKMSVTALAQVDAPMKTVEAAKEQARITQQMFEANNRPYLVITSQQPVGLLGEGI